MNRVTSGRQCKKTVRKNPRLGNIYKVKTSSQIARRASDKRKRVFLPKLKQTQRACVYFALIICVFAIFSINKNELLAYFTDLNSITNIFSIDAQYTVTFDSNTGTGIMPDQIISYNVATVLSTNSFTKDGYAFFGWNTASDGTGTAYADGQSVTNLENITLYAQWIEYCYVTYHFGDENFVGTNYINTDIPLFNSANIHRDFKVTTKLSNFEHISTQDRDTILSNHNETGIPYQGFSISYREDLIKIQGTSTSSNKVIKEWGRTSGSIDFTRTSDVLYFNNSLLVDYYNIISTFDTPLVFGANVNYDGIVRRYLKGDLANICVRLRYTGDEISNLVLPSPTRTNYSFDGWYTEKTGGTRIEIPTAAVLANKTIYAHWTYGNGTYEIKYNSNGGIGTMLNQMMLRNVSYFLTENSYTKQGHIFAGWNTEPDGSGITYTDGQSVMNLAENGIVNLYAQWQDKAVYEVKYAVQIYGINQDVDENENPIGLTFGPATGDNYNNKYVTHTYEETSSGSNEYYVKIITHEVSEDTTESISEEYLYKNGEMETKVIRTLAEKNKYDINLHAMTWVEIANETDKTKFLDCMLCGDTKSVSFTLNNTIASGITYNQYGDGSSMLCNTIKDYYKIWNPSSKDNSYVGTGVSLSVNEQNYGSNAINSGGYTVSHIRATLIGENVKTNKGYAGDVNLDENTCLYSCIQSDLRNIIATKKVKYIAGTGTGEYSIYSDIADKIWLFSSREMHVANSSGQGLGQSGIAYNKFENSESKYYISSYDNDNAVIQRVGFNENGLHYFYCLRSTYYENLTAVLNMNYAGYFGSVNANSIGSGLFFGFCLQDNYQVTFNANGGTGTMANQTISNNVSTALNKNIFTMQDYEFDGWNTKSDGSGTSFTDCGTVTNLGNITLYAQWKKISQVKYAVQIYGINQDEDAEGNTLGLTFGPATGAKYNNAYVTHTYEETSHGSGEYYVKIVTHTVAEDSTETLAEEYLYEDGGTTNKVTRTTAEKNKYDINMHELTWTEIAGVSDKTDFLDCMLCGDTKSVSLKLNDTIASGTTYTQYGDGAGSISALIKDYYRKWNPKQVENSYVGTGLTLNNSELELGSNARNGGGYAVSHIRATLIGENEKTNKSYAGDVNLNEDTCLYSCIESDLKSVITAKKVKYVTGTSTSSYSLNDDIADKIWLFSQREMYGTGNYCGLTTEGLRTNGDGYDKFGNSESKYYISYDNSELDSRKCYAETGDASGRWLRSPVLNTGYYVGGVYNDGGLNNSRGAASPYGISFGFCIN